MPTALHRFDLQSPWAPNPAGPPPCAQFYRRGATVATTASISNGATSSVSVTSTGALAAGDQVQVGFLGPILSVSSVTSPTTVSLHNTTGAPVSIPLGTRLIDLTNQPTAFADSTALYPLGSSVTTSKSGSAVVYLMDGVYDILFIGNAPIADTATTKIYNQSSGSNTTWNHTIAGDDLYLIVGVSWQDSLFVESITDVTITVAGGTPQSLAPIGQTAFTELYALADPPRGVGTLEVTWSGSGAKGAVCGAVCFSYVNTDRPTGGLVTTSGSSIAPQTSITVTCPNSTLVDLLGVNTIASTAGVTTPSQATQLWNGQSASSPASTRTAGAASIFFGTTATIDAWWKLSSSHAYGLVGLELLPSQFRIYADDTGTSDFCSSFGVNALDYGDLQEAIDALGPQGGTVFLPNGIYILAEPIAITRENITLIGEGHGTIIRPLVPNAFDLITVSVSHFRMYNLVLDGLAIAQDLATGKCCLVMNGLGVSHHLVLHCYFENVVFMNAPKHGLHSIETIITTFVSCEFIFNKGDGARLEALPPPVGQGEVCIRFFGCSFSQNGARGLSLNNATAVILSGCNGEGNSQDGTSGVGPTEGSAIEIEALGVCITILNCDFEMAGTAAVENLVYIAGTVASTIQNCNFLGGDGGASAANRGIRNAIGDVGMTIEGCTFNGFQALVDPGAGIPAGAVAVLRGANGFAVANYFSVFGTFVYVESANSIQFVNGSMLKHFAIPGDLPGASSVDAGTMVYLDDTELPSGGGNGNPRAHVQLSDGANWQTLGGGVISIFPDNAGRPGPSAVEPGTLIWVTAPGSAPLENLQFSDGSSWIGIA